MSWQSTPVDALTHPGGKLTDLGKILLVSGGPIHSTHRKGRSRVGDGNRRGRGQQLTRKQREAMGGGDHKKREQR